MSPYVAAALAALVAGYGGFLAGHWIGFGRGMKDVAEEAGAQAVPPQPAYPPKFYRGAESNELYVREDGGVLVKLTTLPSGVVVGVGSPHRAPRECLVEVRP